MEVSDVPPALQQRLGQEATVSLLELFETARQEWTPDVTTAAVDRFERRLGEETSSIRREIAALRLDMHDGFATLQQEMRAADTSLRQDMRDGFATLRQEMHAADAGLRQEVFGGFANLRQENAAARFELLKWCFVFWVGQVFAVAGIFAVVVRLMGT
jgi:hypothetical protein